MENQETYQELMRYALKRFNNAYNTHLINDDLVLLEQKFLKNILNYGKTKNSRVQFI